jgi:hypothetical protein
LAIFESLRRLVTSRPTQQAKILEKLGAVERSHCVVNAGLVEPVALPSEARLDGVEWTRNNDRPQRNGSGARLWLAMGLALATTGAFLMSPYPRHDAQSPAPVVPALSSEFHQSDLPPLVFARALDGGAAAAAYEAQSRESDGARRDALTLGDPMTDGPFLRASARVGGMTRTPLFFVELAREAAEVGQAVAHASSPQADGALLLSDVTLDTDGRQRACLGFRFNGVGAADLSGLACGATGAALERSALMCLIGRLEATPAGAQTGIGKILNAAAAERSPC